MMESSAQADVPVLDFHAHFPVRAEPDAAQVEYVRRFGDAKWAVIRRHLAADQEAWRRAWGFPAPEPAGDDAEMAARWAQEVERHRLVPGGFLTGGGHERLPSAPQTYSNKVVRVSHHDPLAPDPPP